MTPYEQKFQGVTTNSMIEAVQRLTKENREKKQPRTVTTIRRARDLTEMRYALIERLKKMDRTKPEFFPVGSHIEFKNAYTQNAPKMGTVTGYEGAKCIVQLEGAYFPEKVEPKFLTLAFIRS